MSDSKKESSEVVIVSLDYDGCAASMFNVGLRHLSTVPETKKLFYDKLFNPLSRKAEILEIAVGSSRQDRKIDMVIGTHNRNGLCFQQYEELSRALRIETGQNWQLNPVLFADFYRGKPAGTAMQPLITLEDHQNYENFSLPDDYIGKTIKSNPSYQFVVNFFSSEAKFTFVSQEQGIAVSDCYHRAQKLESIQKLKAKESKNEKLLPEEEPFWANIAFKIEIVTAQLANARQNHPSQHIEYHFVDNDPEILLCLQAYFLLNPQPNITIHLHHGHRLPTNKFSLEEIGTIHCDRILKAEVKVSEGPTLSSPPALPLTPPPPLPPTPPLPSHSAESAPSIDDIKKIFFMNPTLYEIFSNTDQKLVGSIAKKASDNYRGEGNFRDALKLINAFYLESAHNKEQIDNLVKAGPLKQRDELVGLLGQSNFFKIQDRMVGGDRKGERDKEIKVRQKPAEDKTMRFINEFFRVFNTNYALQVRAIAAHHLRTLEQIDPSSSEKNLRMIAFCRALESISKEIFSIEGIRKSNLTALQKHIEDTRKNLENAYRVKDDKKRAEQQGYLLSLFTRFLDEDYDASIKKYVAPIVEVLQDAKQTLVELDDRYAQGQDVNLTQGAPSPLQMLRGRLCGFLTKLETDLETIQPPALRNAELGDAIRKTLLELAKLKPLNPVDIQSFDSIAEVRLAKSNVLYLSSGHWFTHDAILGAIRSSQPLKKNPWTKQNFLPSDLKAIIAIEEANRCFRAGLPQEGQQAGVDYTKQAMDSLSRVDGFRDEEVGEILRQFRAQHPVISPPAILAGNPSQAQADGPSLQQPPPVGSGLLAAGHPPVGPASTTAATTSDPRISRSSTSTSTS